jgi:hypothetical protein
MQADPVSSISVARALPGDRGLLDRGLPRPVVSRPLAEALQLKQVDDAQRELLLGLVREAIESGHPDSALRLLDQLWSADLTPEDCWYLRGQALYDLSRFTEAGQVTQRGLTHRPQWRHPSSTTGPMSTRVRRSGSRCWGWQSLGRPCW